MIIDGDFFKTKDFSEMGTSGEGFSVIGITKRFIRAKIFTILINIGLSINLVTQLKFSSYKKRKVLQRFSEIITNDLKSEFFIEGNHSFIRNSYV